MSYWYHPELEEPTVGLVMDYNTRNPEARWKIEFPEGDVYICDYLTSYQSDNSGDLTRSASTTTLVMTNSTRSVSLSQKWWKKVHAYLAHANTSASTTATSPPA